MTATTEQKVLHTHKTTKTPREGATKAKGPLTGLLNQSRDAPSCAHQLNLEVFSVNLDTARELWRRYPELVEMPEFPEPFMSAYRNSTLCEPGEAAIGGEEELLEQGVLKAREPKKSLTLYEIRQLRLDGARDHKNSRDFDETVAEAFTLAESSQGEKAHLAICQALYRRRQELFDIATPLEEFIGELVQASTEGFVSLDTVKEILEGECGDHWLYRDETAQAIQQEDEQTEELRRQYDANIAGRLAAVFPAAEEQNV